MATKEDYLQRKIGKFPVEGTPTRSEDSAPTPSESADGWKSNSFSMPLKGGADLSNFHADNNVLDGPAWTSHSKDRK